MSKKHDATRIQLEDLISLRQQAEMFLLPDSGKKALIGTGNTYSPFKSRGLDFQEVRVYQPGDDIRQIDWHITAKYGKPFTKLYTEEKERTVFFVIDLRDNMQFASHGDFKSVMAARMAAFMAAIADHQKDKIGYLILTNDSLVSSGEADSHSLAPFFNMLVKPPHRKEASDFTTAIRLLTQLLPTGSFVFFFSDFMDLASQDISLLAPLSEKNTFLLCDIYDPLETQLPADTLPFTNGEETLIVSAQHEKIRKKFHDEWVLHKQHLQNVAHKYDWGYLPIATNDDYISALTHFCFGRGVHDERH